MLIHQKCLDVKQNYYSDTTASQTCNYCGDFAIQPLTGQSYCVCKKENGIFQTSEKTCPCRTGYNDNGNSCEAIVYSLCSEGQSRNQNGDCVTTKPSNNQWVDYCKNEICEDKYIGFDTEIGICLCETKDLASICDIVCRTKQKDILTLQCPGIELQNNGANPKVVVQDQASNDKYEFDINNLQNLVNGYAAYESACSRQQTEKDKIDNEISYDAIAEVTLQSIFVMETDLSGFKEWYFNVVFINIEKGDIIGYHSLEVFMNHLQARW